jgi:Uma2 family endonuclease
MIDETILLKFPPELALDSLTSKLLSEFNPEILVEIKDENCITIHGKDFPFCDIDFIGLKLPQKLEISYNQFEGFCELNELYKIERIENDVIRIYMGTPEMIGALTALILIVIGNWVRSHKQGKCYSEAVRFDFKQNDDIKTFECDFSYIAFEKATKEYLNQHRFINIAPTFCIEIVSAKKGLKQNLRKMENEWMSAGTDIGLVVCPHSQKYFLFEKDKTGYQTFDFTIPFIHSLLPGLIVDFDAHWREVRDENE